MDYSIKTRRIAVRMVDDKGHTLKAVFFVPIADTDEFESVGMLQRLNHAESRFLPCEIDGHVELVQVQRIAYLEFRQPLPDLSHLDEVGAQRTRVILSLVNRESMSGELLYEAPAEGSRVSDLLNRAEPRFLILTSPGVVRLINRRAILRARV